jgi:flagellar protein FliL
MTYVVPYLDCPVALQVVRAVLFQWRVPEATHDHRRKQSWTMAEEETPPETETEAEPPKKGGKLVLLGSLAASVALGSVAGLFILGPKLAPTPAHAAAKAAKHDSTDAKKTEVAPIYQMDNLVLNPADSGGTRFLLLSVALEVKDAGTSDMLKGHDAEMRDAILRLFGAKTVDEVAEASSRDALRGEVLAELSKMLPAGSIRRVYFPQFVIQ